MASDFTQATRRVLIKHLGSLCSEFLELEERKVATEAKILETMDTLVKSYEKGAQPKVKGS